MKKILFPTDFSACATNAFRYAVELAKSLNAEITVLHVYQVSEATGVHPSHEQIGVFEKEEDVWFTSLLTNFILQVGAQKHNSSGKELEIKPLTIGGNAVEMIAKESESYDLIIMGSHGNTQLANVLFGSVSSKVSESIVCPLLLIPSQVVYSGTKTIVYSLSLNEKSDTLNINTLILLAQSLRAAIKCLNVVKNEEASLVEVHTTMQLQRKYAAFNKHFLSFKIQEDNHILNGLREYAMAVSANILAVGKTKKGYFEKLFSQNVREALFEHALYPILILAN